MEYDQDSQNNEEGGMMQRIKESPRTVSALIIILIVAAAIYAFSGDETQQTAQVDEGITIEEELQLGTDEDEEAVEDEAAEDTTETVTSTAQPVSQEQLREQRETLPEATQTDEGYVEVAQAGDGITHLARRTTTRYLSDNNAGYTVTNEHRIYIEDYIQNRLGAQGMAIGQSMTISNSLLQEAITAAGQLTPSQLNNLSQYTHALG